MQVAVRVFAGECVLVQVAGDVVKRMLDAYLAFLHSTICLLNRACCA